MKSERTPVPEWIQEEEKKETPEWGFKKYLRGFQLSEDELRDKKIVDVGCGNDALFVRHALDRGFDVVGVDPAVEPELEREGRIIRSELASAGLGNVDLALSYGVIGTHPKIDIRSSIETLLEALNEGGEIRIFPYEASGTLEGIQKAKARIDRALAELGDRIDVRITNVEERVLEDGRKYTRSLIVIRKKP
jgi:hypothetical protein